MYTTDACQRCQSISPPWAAPFIPPHGKPHTKLVHHAAKRGSGVIFLVASGFLKQKTDLVTTKEAAVNSLYINILWLEHSVDACCHARYHRDYFSAKFVTKKCPSVLYLAHN